ncbi:hypothetical protein FBEOM_10030 [Fusarium beomiforme]|uniref:Xylanolytic transcriptional activator regulatory domain-containing protein n=1 Tax=Fusarium beomiforme TaxID=44412 RepID=A0A9P5AD21_9HYPO|nr:hypothetical protein FBEOM_10030 [Fusarium beomiforme]
MESRVSPTEKRDLDRPAISRRSIDDISRDVSSIKSLLAGLGLSRVASAQTSRENHLSDSTVPSPTEANVPTSHQPSFTNPPIPRWDYSAHIISFVQSIVQDNGSAQGDPEWGNTVDSLKSLSNALVNTQTSRSHQTKHHEPPESIPTPPLEAVVKILRWASEHSNDHRIVWICRFLPLDVFLDICNKVYFRVVEDHTEAEFIIANSFLSYVFAEYAVIHGDTKSREYCCFYRFNVGSGLTKLPLLAAPCIKLIAALALGAVYLVEESRASQAWTLISTAMTLCQTLGYHRSDSPKDDSQAMRPRLFWVVYAYEKGLSLRLGRCSGIRDSEVTLPCPANQHRSIRMGRIHGKAYDQLYSHEGLSASTYSRCEAAKKLSQELQLIVDETHAEIAKALAEGQGINGDPMKVIYLHCDLVCQSSLMAMVLRVLPGSHGTYVHESCITVARNTLDLHDQCMKLVNGCKDPLLIRRYINWGILHTPFFPFSIIFTHAVRHAKKEDLDRLDRFAASFQSETASSEPVTHPHRLYELLSRAARLSTKACPDLLHTNETLSSSSHFTMVDPESIHTMSEVGTTDFAIGAEYDASDVGEWFHSNQQFLRLLHEDVPY